MASNPYVNKVIYGNSTLIDISDTTATEYDVAEGKYFYAASGEKKVGTAVTGGMTVIETPDSHGGTIVTITGEAVTLQAKTVTPTASTQTVEPDTGYTAMSVVTVNAIPSEYIIPSGTKSITSNGTGIDVTEYASVDIAVPSSEPNLQDKTVNPSTSQQTVEADSQYDGLGTVTVNAMPSGSASTPATTITANPSISVNSSTGLITATASASESIIPSVSAGYVSSGTAGTVTVSGSNTSQLSTQSAVTATPTESEQTIVSAGKYTLGAIKVGAISSTYVGSEIDRNDSTDLTSSGATVSVPAGYYAENASKSVASGSATTPSTSITANPSISVNSSTGVITASVSGSKSVTPTVSAGYVSSGTAGTITVSGSNTSNLSTQAAATITPTKQSQTAVAAGKYTLGAVTVAAIPAAYQDVSSVDATASDVISGKKIVNSSGTVVTGELVIQHYYTGSGTPSSSTGVNGDIYLKTS